MNVGSSKDEENNSNKGSEPQTVATTMSMSS